MGTIQEQYLDKAQEEKEDIRMRRITKHGLLFGLPLGGLRPPAVTAFSLVLHFIALPRTTARPEKSKSKLNLFDQKKKHLVTIQTKFGLPPV